MHCKHGHQNRKGNGNTDYQGAFRVSQEKEKDYNRKQEALEGA
jgi:hypothetical protein